MHGLEKRATFFAMAALGAILLAIVVLTVIGLNAGGAEAGDANPDLISTLRPGDSYGNIQYGGIEGDSFYLYRADADSARHYSFPLKPGAIDFFSHRYQIFSVHPDSGLQIRETKLTAELLSPPAAASEPEYTGHYGSTAKFIEARVNGKTLAGNAEVITVRPGQAVTGYLKVLINRKGPETSVFPVAGTFSWNRNEITTVSKHLVPGVETVQYNFDTTAPTKQGKYFIAVIAGPYMSASAILTRDYDIWSTDEAGWMNAVNHSYIVAFKGGKEQHVAKAICIEVKE